MFGGRWAQSFGRSVRDSPSPPYEALATDKTKAGQYVDRTMATIHGNVLRGFINGEEVISATDDVFESGSPGIGFNFFVGNTNVDHGFTYFEVDTDDD